MNKTIFSVRLRHAEGSWTFAREPFTILSPEETLVPDARAGLSPSEMVDRKLSATLDGDAANEPYTRPAMVGANRRRIIQTVK